METFEVHITGDESILRSPAVKDIKTISVELLRPDKSVIRTEHMTSHVMKCDSYVHCLSLVWTLIDELTADGVKIIRAKIETPYYEHYREQSLYMESHFVAEEATLPISRNTKKSAFLATDRTYLHKEYDAFREKYKNAEVELCLFDSFILEDADWFALYV